MNQEAEPQDASQTTALSPFLAVWTGQAFSLLGSELVQVTLVWWLAEKTGSATVLARGRVLSNRLRVNC